MGKNVFLKCFSWLGARLLGTYSMLIWHTTTKDPYTPLDVRLFEKAVELDPRYCQAWLELGECFRYGWGTPVDQEKAYGAFCHGAALSSPKCCKLAADMIYRNECGDHDREKMYRLYRYAAEYGYKSALIHLGLCFEEGDGVLKNSRYAMRCYEEADRLGVPFGSACLADNYFYGIGVPQDRRMACTLWKKAARKGEGYAMYRVGLEYYFGEVLKKDYRKAVRLFRKAVKKDYLSAMFILGKCYLRGDGVKVDRERGLELIRQAAEKGDLWACTYLGVFENEEPFLEKAVQAGDPTAMCCRADGLRREEKFREAAKFYEKCWEQGYEPAGRALAEMYLWNELEPMDVEKVKAIGEVLEKSEDPEFIHVAWGIFSDIYLQYTREFDRGITYTRLLAENGDASAFYNLGMAYRYGLGVEVDEEEAVHFLQQSADLGFEPAIKALASEPEEG